ncbi:MAG: translation initiation factor IF-2 [Planctomycetes bacterium]|nr:translation initiation factor IF-2 [Planctomycetota bacterium]
MKKVRVHELAKDYGMQAKDLAKLLQDLGFSQVKTNMSALDEADLMMVEARLATSGVKKQAAPADAGAGTAIPKKKLLSTAAAEPEPAPTEAEADASGESSGTPVRKDSAKKPLPKAPLKKPLTKRELPTEAAPAGTVPAATGPSATVPAATGPSVTGPTGTGPTGSAAGVATPAKTASEPAQSKPAPASPAPEPVRPAAAPTAHAAPKPPEAAAPAAEAVSAPAAAAADLRPAASVTPAAQAAPVAPAAPTPTVAAPDVRAAAEAAPAPRAASPSAAPAAGATDAVATPKAAHHSTSTPAPEAPRVQEQPAAQRTTQPAAPAASAPGNPPAAEAEVDPVRKLLVPQKKATVVGRIELPQETIRDARSRSAPAAPRDLKRQALQKMQQRFGQRPGGPPTTRRGPGGPTGGRMGGRDMGRTGPGVGPGRRKVAAPLDPNRVVEVEEPVSMKALSEALGIKVTELIQTFFLKLKIPGKNINSMLTNEEVELVGLELERNIKIVEHKEAMDQLIEQLVEDSADESLQTRAPVVTFMGHVDHGKTSLMDALRSSDVAKHEAGGITQHIGAYKVENEHGQQFVILDTPGHAAFTAMRARGAELTDIVVLVVAGDDGVMPQTEEAISHALAAKVPIVVAITKCDLPQSKPKQVMQQLMIKGLQAEEFGGTTGVVEVSAVKGQGLDELVDRILLEAEVLTLTARPDAPGKGVVVEARQSAEQGVVVTLLVSDGTLRLKDQVVCGESFARIRAMIDDHGRNLEEAGPSTPVTIYGLDRLPAPGDKLFVVEDAKKAREVVEERQRRVRELSRAERSAVTLETLSAKLAEKDVQEIKLILKADAMGSLEPLKKCLEELATGEVRVNLVHAGLGGINKADVDLAATSTAVIVGFNTVADANVRQLAEQAGVEIRYYDVIYELLDQVRAAMEGLLAPQEVQNVIGHAEVKATFRSSKFGLIAGCRVLDGIARRSASVRLSRDGAVVWSGKIASLRRGEEDVRDVKAGIECGMTLEGYQDIKVGDVLEFVTVELVKRTLGG